MARLAAHPLKTMSTFLVLSPLVAVHLSILMSFMPAATSNTNVKSSHLHTIHTQPPPPTHTHTHKHTNLREAMV